MLLVVGAPLYMYLPDVYYALAHAVGSNAEAGLRLVELLLTVIRLGVMPKGTSLIAAAVVIQTLRADRALEHTHDVCTADHAVASQPTAAPIGLAAELNGS